VNPVVTLNRTSNGGPLGREPGEPCSAETVVIVLWEQA
jgi:hypothetical protein